MWARASFTQAVERQTIRMNILKDSVEQSTATYSNRDPLPRLNPSKMVNKLKPVTLGYSGSVLHITEPWCFPFGSWKLKARWCVSPTEASAAPCGTVPQRRGSARAARKRQKGGSFLAETQDSRWHWKVWISRGPAVENRSKTQSILSSVPGTLIRKTVEKTKTPPQKNPPSNSDPKPKPSG